MDNRVLLASPLLVGSITIRNRVFLAPMSGVSDEPFRRRAHAHGAGLVVSEMVASGELTKGRADSALRIVRPDVDIHMVQLAGRETEAMAEAARIAVGEGADIIDINMGCPAKKVTGGYCGSALMREPDHALRLIEAVTCAVSEPVTLKMRLGWDDHSLNAADIAVRAENAGIAMITIHGRTRCQFYEGRADWAKVAAVKSAVGIPVVVNGDILCERSAAKALRLSGADAVMVGRAHCGSPWAAGAIAGNAGRGAYAAAPEDGAALAAYVVGHYDDMLHHYGRERGLRHARKHLRWYLERHAPDTPHEMTSALVTSLNPESVKSNVARAFEAVSGHSLEKAA